jgi:hypothetical protein
MGRRATMMTISDNYLRRLNMRFGVLRLKRPEILFAQCRSKCIVQSRVSHKRRNFYLEKLEFWILPTIQCQTDLYFFSKLDFTRDAASFKCQTIDYLFRLCNVQSPVGFSDCKVSHLVLHCALFDYRSSKNSRRMTHLYSAI